MEGSREKYWPAIMRGSEDVDVASRRESLEVEKGRVGGAEGWVGDMEKIKKSRHGTGSGIRNYFRRQQ